MSGTVYLSGPIAGLTYDEARYGWRKTAFTFLAGHYEMQPRLSITKGGYDEVVFVPSGITVLSPMRHEGHLAEIRGALEPADQTDHFFSGSRIIYEKDKLDIERSDIVLVNVLGATKVSIGTVAEIGMAAAMGKQIIVVIEDSGNVHDHPFVTVPASLRLNNLDDALYAIKSLLSEGL